MPVDQVWVADGDDFGVMIDAPVCVDMVRVKARKDEIVESSNAGLTKWVEGMKDVTRIRGHARFDGPHSVSVNDETLTAERIFIDVGGRARVTDFPGRDDVGFLTNSGMMEIDALPEHLVIVGGSYIGLEFAQIYRRFGAQVTVVEMQHRLIAREDEDVSHTVQEIFEEEGVTIRLKAKCLGFERGPSGIRMNIDCELDATPVDGSYLLVAVGRAPNTHDLGLQEARTKTDERGFISVDEELWTNVSGLWAIGEVNGRGEFTHTSYNDCEIVAANLFDDDSRRTSDRMLCYGLSIDPPLGRVGMTERDARSSGRKVLVGIRKRTQGARSQVW